MQKNNKYKPLFLKYQDRLNLIPAYHGLAFGINIRDLTIGNEILIELVDKLIDKEKIALIGANGSGKSTFLKLLHGENLKYSGDLYVNPRLRIFYLSQNFPKIEVPLVEYFKEKYSLNAEETYEYLESIGLTPTSIFNNLSEGEKCRVLFTEILIIKPNVLLLDEPTNYLDVESVEHLIEFINVFPGAVIFCTHNKYLVKKCAIRIWAIEDRNINEYRNFNEYMEKQKYSKKI